MNELNLDYFRRCIHTLDRSYNELKNLNDDAGLYDIYRAACVKEFEIILEQAGKLLKKHLRPFFSSNRDADRLHFKEIFRQAAKYDVISIEESERWLTYRDCRNDTAHLYGEDFADVVIHIVPQFHKDALQLSKAIQTKYE